MQKNSIHIYQFIGIILLLCGYLYSNIPDSLSEMYFNPNPSCPTVISKPDNSLQHDLAAQAKICSKSDSRHRSNQVKYISLEILVPPVMVIGLVAPQPLEHACSLIEKYKYLYYTEINPPPPRILPVSEENTCC